MVGRGRAPSNRSKSTSAPGSRRRGLIIVSPMTLASTVVHPGGRGMGRPGAVLTG